MLEEIKKVLIVNKQPVRFAKVLAAHIQDVPAIELEDKVLDLLYRYKLHNEDL